MRGDRLRAALVLAAIAAAAALTVPRLGVRTAVTDFLPTAGDRELAQVARRLADSELSRTITFTIEAPDRATAAEAAGALGRRLEDAPGVAWVRAGPGETFDRTFYELYYPRRLGWIADRPEKIDALVRPEALRERIRELKRQVTGPAGPFVRQLAPGDPWMIFLKHLERVREAMQGELDVHDGHFVAGQRGQYGVVLLATDHSPFETDAQRALQAAIAEAFEAIDAEHGRALSLEQGGVHRLAIHSEDTIRADITRVSTAGAACVVVLILLLFRSPRQLLIAAIPLAAGTATAAAVCQMALGSVHGLTLAFGATLIGVTIDYVAHYLSHHHLHPDPDGPEATARRVWPGLLLGAATTIAGLAGLAWTSVPAIREIALFGAVGVGTALAVTRWVLPPFMPAAPAPGPLLGWLARGARRVLDVLGAGRRVLWVLPALAVVVCLAGLLRLEWNDDLRELGSPEPELLAEDERVRARVARVDTGRAVIASGQDLEQALERNDRVAVQLQQAEVQGDIERSRSVHSLLWSRALQQRNRQAVPDDAWERTVRALEAEGFVADRFEPFRRALTQPLEPLRFEHLEATPLERLVSPFRLRVGDRVALLSFVRGVRDAEALARQLERIDGVRWLDQQRLMERAYRTFRQRTLELIAAGLVVVLLLLFLRYRRPGVTLAAFLPALLAACTALAVVGLLGVRANLMHVIAMLLVLSMGVDYGVFMIESGRERRHAEATLVALVGACMSTVLSFSMLGLSSNPAMQALGLTAALGVAFALVLAPVAWLLAAPAPHKGP